VIDVDRKQRLRLLLVSDLYPPYIGGAARSTSLLAHGLARRGHVVSVATSWQVGTRDGTDGSGLVPTGSVEALVSAMHRLVSDAALRDRMGRAAMRRASLLTSEVVLPQFEALYHEIVARAGHGSGPSRSR
jgi:hypothetical protein